MKILVENAKETCKNCAGEYLTKNCENSGSYQCVKYIKENRNRANYNISHRSNKCYTKIQRMNGLEMSFTNEE